VTLLSGGAPSFGVAADLNPPEFIEVYTGGTLSWSYTGGSGGYIVDMSRHAESAGVGAVDTYGAVLNAAGATLLGWASTGSGAPAWNISLPGCNTDGGGGTYIGLEASDDGSRVAFFCPHVAAPGANATARVYGIDGQTGAHWFYDLGARVRAGQGSVRITGDGAWVLFVNEQGVPDPNSSEGFVLDGATGALRGDYPIPFFITAAISDSGNYVVAGDESVLHVYKWSGSSYVSSGTLTPPAGPRGWIPWDLEIGTGADGSELVVSGSIAGDVLSVQVAAWVLSTGAPVLAWSSPVNTKLQENPTLRVDGGYIAAALWGDVGEAGYPTVVLLNAASPTPNVPIFQATTPGSMFAVDVAYVSTASTDTVYLTACGKAVPANEFGNGGSAWGWSVSVSK